MRKLSYAWGSRAASDIAIRCLTPLLIVSGCATPQYAIRPTPVPEESVSALQIERAISAIQAEEFDQEGARPIGSDERVAGFAVQSIVNRLSRVTERPSLAYRAFLYQDQNPNAAALADGRIYLSSGLLGYLAQRGSRADELAFVLGHELAHTVAQHLVKRTRALQQQQLLMAIVAAGAGAIAKQGGAAEQAGRIALDAASIIQDVRNSGYSQEHELEADQLGIRYVIRAGFDPRAALAFLKDFERFDSPSPLLRTHPYIALRRAYLERYLQETGAIPSMATPPAPPRFTTKEPVSGGNNAARLRSLRETQRLYPTGSVSWKNLQAQIDALESQ